MAIIIIWGGFWFALALVLGGSPALALLMGTAAFIVPLVLLFIVGLIGEFVVNPYQRHKRRKRFEARRKS